MKRKYINPTLEVVYIEMNGAVMMTISGGTEINGSNALSSELSIDDDDF